MALLFMIWKREALLERAWEPEKGSRRRTGGRQVLVNDEKIKKVFERVVKALGVDDDINDDGEE